MMKIVTPNSLFSMDYFTLKKKVNSMTFLMI